MVAAACIVNSTLSASARFESPEDNPHPPVTGSSHLTFAYEQRPDTMFLLEYKQLVTGNQILNIGV